MQAWRTAWRERSFRTALLVAAIAAVPIAMGLPIFFHYIGMRPGHVLNDPVLNAIGPVDVTWLTFTVLYATLFISIVRASREPWTIVRGLHAYAILMMLRVMAMWCFTLEPPTDIIPLVDPITQSFYPGGVPFLKDLFFSGHTASIALMVCISHGRVARRMASLATAAVGVLVLVQHVHWTVDVLAAPVFVWLAWKASALTLNLCGARPEGAAA